MTEKTKEEELKQKLLDFFDKKLTDFTTKFESDIDIIEKMKYEYFDTVIKKYQEIEEEHKKQEAEEKEKHEKEKPEKKADESKHEKIQKKKIDPSARPKTPMVSTKKPKLKEDKTHDKTEIHKEKKETKPKAAAPKTTGNTKASAPKKTDATKRPTTGKADPKAKTAAKKGTANAKKVDPKKGGKKAPTKKDKKEEKKEEEKQPEVEEKKPVIIKGKYILNIPDDLKTNAGLSCIYSALKGQYITDKKQVLHLTTFSPLLYKSFGSSMKFLLDEKKAEVQNKANEIEKFLNNYGDLNTYLTKEFSLSKKAINSIQFFKKKEEEEILKMAEIPKEVGMVLKCLYYIIDENVDENMGNKELFENMLKILNKHEDKSFKSLLVNYCNQNKYLNLTKEKFDKINNIINENNTILNMITMTKLSRPFSLFCFLLKEVHDYINLKTLDGQYFFDLRMKNNELQKYKDILYLIENDGKPREPPKEEPKVEEAPKTEPEVQPTGEETQKTEEGVPKEEAPKTEEASKTEEAPKSEEVPASTEGEQPGQA